MGRDIAMFVEYVDADGVHAWAEDAISIPRDYRLFAALDGRSAPRGLPLDLSSDVFEQYFLFVVDDASASSYRGFEYVTLAEADAMIAAGTAHRPPPGYVKYNTTSPLGYVSGPDRNAANWLWSSEVRERTSAIVSSPQWAVLVDVLDSIERRIAGARARIVFWYSG